MDNKAAQKQILLVAMVPSAAKKARESDTWRTKMVEETPRHRHRYVTLF